MSKLVFDQSGQRFYETGVKECVLFPKNGTDGAYATGVAWNGISAITEKPTGADANAIYADDIKYLELRAIEEFEFSIECYQYPEEFNVCNGVKELVADSGVYVSQQERVPFGLVYKTTLGNDTEKDNYGYKLHIIYGATISPSESQFQTINDSPEAMSFSFDATTTPIEYSGFKPIAHLELDSTKVATAKMTQILNSLYGTDGSGSGTGTQPTLLLPAGIAAILEDE